MGNGPSTNCLKNRVDIYAFTPSKDSNAFLVGDGTAYTTLVASAVPCSVQPGETEILYDAQMRPTAHVQAYKLTFRTNPGTAQRYKAVWVDDRGVSRSIILSGPARNMAGRSNAWHCTGEERL